MTKRYKLLLEHARQVVQITTTRAPCLTGEDMKNISVLEGETEGYSVLVDCNGRIAQVDQSSKLRENLDLAEVETVLDATDHCLLPGFIDGHTHPVWEGDRVHEFAMKLAGATYMDIHQAGGGIHFTVDHTRAAEESVLYASYKQRLGQMLQAGTTLVECKSGYGLDWRNELKMLRVIERAKQDDCPSISSTYCGAHAVPKGSTAEEATQSILKQELPGLQAALTSGELSVDNIDVFCEQGVFSVAQTREILRAGKDMGLNINFHGEELHRLESPQMGCELGALAISHLEEVSKEGIDAMARSKTAAVILPTTAYCLHLKPPPVRDMLNSGVIVALGSDFNPNAHCLAMPVVMNLACVTLGMSMNEALVAATLNAAYSLAKSDQFGSIEVGKLASLVMIRAPKWEHIIYQLGGHSDLITKVIHKGKVVYSKT